MESKLFRLKRIKAQLWRFFPVFFLFFAVILIVLSITGNSIVHSVKRGGVVVFEPVVSFVSKPLYWLKGGMDSIKNWSSVYYENEKLKEENEYLLKWRSLALQLAAEQKELKEHLNYVPPQKTRHLLAKIVLTEGDAFSRSFCSSRAFFLAFITFATFIIAREFKVARKTALLSVYFSLSSSS